ncbi:metacaspase type II MCP1 [Gracilaria domingensis]|nr:metacaspase type II MCP1 [Gracilaria domingensis]
MGKFAVVVGINYVNNWRYRRELNYIACDSSRGDYTNLFVQIVNGCLNDALNIGAVLSNEGFSVLTLSDDDKRLFPPTKPMLKLALKLLCSGREPGDTVFFSFSGHGTQVPNDDDDKEADKMDEAIVTQELDLITDDELQEQFASLPSGVTAIAVMDCCHSGTMFDEANVLIGGEKSMDNEKYKTSSTQTQSREFVMKFKRKNRFIAAQSISEELSAELGKPVTSSRKAITTAQEQLHATLHSIQPMKQIEAFIPRIVSTARAAKQDARNVCILMSGCQAGEESSDVQPDDSPPFGAFSKTLVDTYKEEAGISFFDLMIKVRAKLHAQGFPQNPCLEGPSDAMQLQFLR